MKNVALALFVLWSLAAVFFVGRYSVRVHVHNRMTNTDSTLGCHTFYQTEGQWGFSVYFPAKDGYPEVKIAVDCF